VPVPPRQREIYTHGARLPIAYDRLEAAARQRLSPQAYAYVAGGAGREDTMSANRAAFGKWSIVPRMLADVAGRDISCSLFGRPLAWPLVLCPVGVLELAHPDADLAVARAARAAGVPMIFSNQASCNMEACAAVMGDSPRWFQLYWSRSNELAASLVSRAERCGCEAIVITLDTPLLGWRIRDLELGYLPFLEGRGLAQYFSDPVFQRLIDDPGEFAEDAEPPKVTPRALKLYLDLCRRFPGPLLQNLRSRRPLEAVRRFMRVYTRLDMTFEKLAFLRERTKLPLLLKGILHPDDARQALEAGIDGIIVSNHGGRQVDGALAALEALPKVVEAVGGRVPVIFDSGIRGGADIFKALCLGATAVGLGRPYVWGLALGGQGGVEEVLGNLRADFELSLSLSGCRSLADLSSARLQ